MKKKPLVSIISVNYNQSTVTVEFLKSIKKITYPNYEVIIVDNASPNDNPDIIKTNFPDVKLIKSKTNLGFAGGNNIGILASKGEYLLFINNDTEVESDFLEYLVDAFETDNNLGMVSPKILFFNSKNKKTLQYAGGTEINYTKGAGRFIGYGEVDSNKYKTSYTNLIHGAAVMVPRKLMYNVGVWPDMYFLYYEEIDWSEHFKRAGYKLKYIAESKVYHKESMSIGKATPLRIYYMNRNRLLFVRRNAKGFLKYKAVFYYVFTSFPKSVLYFFYKRKWDLLKALLRAFAWNISHYKKMKQSPKLTVKNGNDIIINSFFQY